MRPGSATASAVEAPQVMAGLRNAALTLRRGLGIANIPEAVRENAYPVADLLPRLGVMNL